MNGEAEAIIAGVTEHVASLAPEPPIDRSAWERTATRELARGAYLPDVASALTGDYDAQIKSVEDDPDLTLEAKRRRINAITDEANAVSEVFRQVYEDAVESEIRTLSTSLRRPDAGLSPSRRFEADLSMRDALERCEKAIATDVTGRKDFRKLNEMYDAAVLRGDDVFARAAFSVAMDSPLGGRNIIDAWLSDHPADGEKLARLWDLESSKEGASNLFGLAVRFRGIG